MSNFKNSMKRTTVPVCQNPVKNSYLCLQCQCIDINELKVTRKPVKNQRL